jgi:hypothetical protein
LPNPSYIGITTGVPQVAADPHNRAGGRPYEPLSDSLFAHRNTIHAHPSTRGFWYRRGCYGGRGLMAGAFDASSLLSGVALIWGTVKAGYSAAVIASIIAAVRGSVKIVVHVRQTGNAVATVANAIRQTMATAVGWPTALCRHLANAWSAPRATAQSQGDFVSPARTCWRGCNASLPQRIMRWLGCLRSEWCLPPRSPRSQPDRQPEQSASTALRPGLRRPRGGSILLPIMFLGTIPISGLLISVPNADRCPHLRPISTARWIRPGGGASICAEMAGRR